MKKSNKKQKGTYVKSVKQKPHTLKQENDIVLGKIIMWSFLVSLPLTGLFALGMSWDIKVCLLLWGILSLLFAFYNLIGLIFKWDHARVCTKCFLKKTYKFDIKNNWTKEDIEDSIFEIVIWSVFGVIFLIGSIFH